MAETKNSLRENVNHEILGNFKKNPLNKSNNNQSNRVETFDPYTEDAKHSKYWRSLQSFKPLRFSR